jgi:hypothetical protein
LGFSSGFGSGFDAGFEAFAASGFGSVLASGLGAAGLGSAFGSALGSVFTSGLGAGALGSILGAGLVSALISGFGAGGFVSALGIALVSVLSSGLGTAALDSTFGTAFGSGLGAGLEATAPGSDLGSDLGAVLAVVLAAGLGVMVRGSALDRSSVRGAVFDLGATVDGAFWAVLASDDVVVLGLVLDVVLAVDPGVVVRGSALDLSSFRGAVSDLGATVEGDFLVALASGVVAVLGVLLDVVLAVDPRVVVRGSALDLSSARRAVSDLGAKVEGAFGAVLASDDVAVLGAVLDTGAVSVRDGEAALVSVLGAIIGLATARVFGRPPLALANDALSALAAVMCCV